jgi:hypothetical protein
MIFIRLVEGGSNEDSRFKIAFKDVCDDKWSVFSNANELPRKLYTDEDPINSNDNVDLTNLNNAIILPTSLYYNILSMLFTLLFRLTYN